MRLECTRISASHQASGVTGALRCLSRAVEDAACRVVVSFSSRPGQKTDARYSAKDRHQIPDPSKPARPLNTHPREFERGNTDRGAPVVSQSDTVAAPSLCDDADAGHERPFAPGTDRAFGRVSWTCGAVRRIQSRWIERVIKSTVVLDRQCGRRKRMRSSAASSRSMG